MALALFTFVSANYDVIVKQKNTLQIKLGSGDVLIEPDFEVEKGAMLEIK